MLKEVGNDLCRNWSPRLTKLFLDFLRTQGASATGRRLTDRTINRIISHLKPFANWLDNLKQIKGLEIFDPFPLGNPMSDFTPNKT